MNWSIIWFRSSHPEVFLGKGVLKMCSKFTGDQPCRIVISIKLLCNFIEITLRHGCSPVNLLHTFRTRFRKDISGWLLLIILILILSFYSAYHIIITFNAWCSSKRSYIIKQTSSFQLLVCLCVYERLVDSTLHFFSWRRSLSYRNQSIDSLCKSIDWFLYDRDIRHPFLQTVFANFFLTKKFKNTIPWTRYRWCQ